MGDIKANFCCSEYLKDGVLEQKKE